MDDRRAAQPDDPGPLLASGRAADVFDVGDGRVVRRYRKPEPRIDLEARIMKLLADHGVRVPAVFDLDAGLLADRDIVMERIDGVNMLEDLEKRPWKALAYPRLLARLQRQIAAVSAPDWMLSPGWATSGERVAKHTDSVLHLDLHPMNVMLSPDGPVVIDWTNATGGPAGFDAAITFTIMSTFELTDPKDRLAQQAMVRTFRRSRGPREIDAFLVAACDHRLIDANLTPGERVNVAALRKNAISRTGRSRPRS